MMKSIGGYFGLELRQGHHFHRNCINLNTARNCFELILRNEDYQAVWMPRYTCEVMLEPIKKVGVDVKYYSIDKNFDPTFSDGLPVLQQGEAFLYTNYFGIKSSTVKRLSKVYKDNLIIDNSQAFFSSPIEGCQTFYSARKFFGVPDGAYLYTNKKIDESFQIDKSFERMSHLLRRIEGGAEQGYYDFRKNDSSLSGQPIKEMSKISSSILSSIDYESASIIRKGNFEILHSSLKDLNRLKLEVDEDDVPMIYPFVYNKPDLRDILINEKIYVATYWQNVIDHCLPQSLEYEMANCLLPLPIDQRYGSEDMKRIIDIVLKNV